MKQVKTTVMGSSRSKIQPEHLEFPPPIQTRGTSSEACKLPSKFYFGLGLEAQHWFTQMFDIFCTQKELIKFWSEANLACFMQTIFPPNLELRQVLMDAVPIMHRCLLRLGSYPYQNDPEEFLTHDVLRTAILLVYHAWEEIRSDYLDNHTRAIIYQSMARIDQEKIQKKKQASRGAGDDEDLENVLDLLANKRRHNDNPKAMIRGPSHPPAAHFPSSWSADFNQTLPAQEFRSFIRLMLVLYPDHIDVDKFAMTLTEVERITDCILSAFLRHRASLDDDITFDIFNPVIGDNTPGLLEGCPRLLNPLICPKPLPDGINRSPEGLCAFFRESYNLSISTRQTVPMSGLIFNLPILSQLGFLLPLEIPQDDISVAWSAKADQIHDWSDLSCRVTQSAIMRLLVSGSNSQDEHMIFGLFKDSKSSQTVCSFQLKPVHRAFRLPPEGKENCSIQVESIEGGESVLGCRLTAKHQTSSLVLNTKGLGHFSFQRPDDFHCASVDEKFHVDAVELLQSD